MRTVEMAQQLKVFTVFAEDWSSVLSIQARQFTTNFKSVSRSRTPSSGLSGQAHAHVDIRTYNHK